MNFRGLHIALILLLFVSCTKQNLTTKRFENLEPFDRVQLDSSFNVFLSEGEEYSVEVRADEKIIDNIDVFSVEGLLTVDNSTRIKWARPRKGKIEIHITSPPLAQVVANKTCFVQTKTPITSVDFGIILKDKANEAKLDLNCTTFYYWNNFPCGGRLTLTGQTEELKLWNYALMTVDARELQTAFALVENNAQGNCIVNVSERLEYDITGAGDILLYGQPSEIIEGEVSSTGELIEL